MFLVLADDDGRGIEDRRYKDLKELYENLVCCVLEDDNIIIRKWAKTAVIGDVLDLYPVNIKRNCGQLYIIRTDNIFAPRERSGEWNNG